MSIVDDFGNELRDIQYRLPHALGVRPQRIKRLQMDENLPDTPDNRMLSAVQRWSHAGLLEALTHQANANAYFGMVSILHLACAQNAPVLTSLLLEHGASVDAQDDRGATPLHLAAKVARCAVLRNLLAHHANIQAEDHTGKTPLHMASAYGNLAAVRFLVEHGAPIEARDHMGRTPFLAACASGSITTATYLAGKGCMSLACDAHGQNGLSLCSMLGSNPKRRLSAAFAAMDLPLHERRETPRMRL